MKNNDVKLIQQVLAGDESAFAEIVKKYQKPVHVLAWRKVGDFHIAEEITQDTFLKVYQRLHTLKDPNQFSGWLYVIATRRCYAWLRKKRIRTQPLEDSETTMEQRDVYSQHVIDERKNSAAEAQREVVKILLAKLKESERTVMTLHYLGEMTVGEISKFLGVSAGTIKSRLQRARHRLQKEETMIREALDHFQISPNLTDNIMQEISRLKPSPSASKPLVPWIAAASSIVLIVLMLGIGSQYLARFQQPYSLDAPTEMTVELVDTPIVLNVEAKLDVQNRLGNPNIVGKSDNSGQKPDEVLLTAIQTEGKDELSVPKQQWIQTNPIKGTFVESLFATPEGELYTYANGHIYRLHPDETKWQHVYDFSQLIDIWNVNHPLLGKWDNTLYIVLNNKLYASNDAGKTWNIIHSWREDMLYGYKQEFFLSEKVFYLPFSNGVMRSYDRGKTWTDVSDEEPGLPNSFITIQNTVFALMDSNLYRMNGVNWHQLEVPEKASIVSATGTKDRLYVIAVKMNDNFIPDLEIISKSKTRSWWIFRSTDLGDSWTDITPTNAWSLNGFPPGKIVAAGDTLLVMERGMVRSTDGGDTWMPPQLPGTSPSIQFSNPKTVALNEDIFYVNSWEDGLTRTTDGGKTWEGVNIAPDREMDAVLNLTVGKIGEKRNNIPSTLYARVYTRELTEIVKTIDEGKSWHVVQVEIPITDPYRVPPPNMNQIVKSDGVVYAKGQGGDSKREVRIYRVAQGSNTLEPIHTMPTFDDMHLRRLLRIGMASRGSDKSYTEQLQKSSPGATQFFKQLVQMGQKDEVQLETFLQYGSQGSFDVSNDTFYMEYNFKLFRWKQGEPAWFDTGLEENMELNMNLARMPLKLATSGDTVYIGKRNGHLFVSLDRGNNWIDITPTLPFNVIFFNDIVVAGTTVCVATDGGIITSDDGKNWVSVYDTEGKDLSMEHLTVDGTSFYGVSKDIGIYRLDNGTWNQIVSEIPENITSFAVDGNTIYVGTQDHGMLHYNLEE